MKKGVLYLVPSSIAEETQQTVIPEHVRQALPGIRHFLAEDIRTARRFLSSLKLYASIEPLQFEVLNKDTKPAELKALFQPLLEGHNLGVISESGCPGVADPGALAVKYAHEQGIQVAPLVGPSSLLLALMGSGLNGQRFTFHGYLPIDSKEAAAAIKTLEKESQSRRQTQLFIETPYRNNAMLKNLLQNLQDDTLLCIAVDLTGKEESIKTLPVSKWKNLRPELPKVPAVFLFLA
ncbi:SAM-dependent methyltransferase [Parachryseolinea silvisoli]|uniref:SAM-dependent methyltransferase n=1 Tax=Parachryseolinea silvisoli TaxID=2873601 RepID=UPI002265DF3E|nr:SAM-dependent methyltransferase [Parachryseolinea silvisoli]MCD9016230.1 SAM-dependent methyltransferase [Parachryseolinea silvisoli]